MPPIRVEGVDPAPAMTEPYDVAPHARFPMLMLGTSAGSVWSFRTLDHLTLWNTWAIRTRVLDGATLLLPSLATCRIVRAEKLAPKPPFFGWTLTSGRVWRMRLMVEDTGARPLALLRAMVIAKMREPQEHRAWDGADVRAVAKAPTFEALCLVLPATTDL